MQYFGYNSYMHFEETTFLPRRLEYQLHEIIKFKMFK